MCGCRGPVLHRTGHALPLQMSIFPAEGLLLLFGVPTAEGLERAWLLLPRPALLHRRALSFPRLLSPSQLSPPSAWPSAVVSLFSLSPSCFASFKDHDSFQYTSKMLPRVVMDLYSVLLCLILFLSFLCIYSCCIGLKRKSTTSFFFFFFF